jgi:hypothetical protein
VRYLALLAALAVLAGCPIPQPLPDYPKGQPVTPPRIVLGDTLQYPETVVRVPAGCAVAPIYPLAAELRDAITNESFSARWFVNYDPDSQPAFTPQQDDLVPGMSAGAQDTLRQLPRPFTFPPYQYAPTPGTGGGAGSTAGALHVVELVVSNGFDPAAQSAAAALPYRTPLVGFEVQVYRWVFLTVPASAAVPCPESPAT